MAKTTDVTLDSEARTVAWRLSVSKTDPAALGCERRWGCICTDNPGLGCPYHAARDQMDLLCALFGDRVEEGSLPFFPDAKGFVVSDAGMSGFVDELAKLAGPPLALPSGVRRFGKHSFRSTGAVLLARLGIDIFKIQLLARWASPVVLHYARDAPMETITAQVKTALAKDTIGELINKLTKDVAMMETELKNMDQHTLDLIRLELEVVK